MTGLSWLLVVMVVLLMVGGMPIVSILSLKEGRRDKVAKMKALAEKGDLPEDEVKAFDALKAEIKGLDTQISRLEAVAEEESRLAVTDPVPSRPSPEGGAPKAKKVAVPNPGFESFGEMVAASVYEPNDERFEPLRVSLKVRGPRGEIELKTGNKGGLMVPTEIDPALQRVSPQSSIVRPRATVVPPGDAPEADFTMPALNQQSGSNMYGGVTVGWTDEGGDIPETDITLKEALWSPKEVSCYIPVSNKALRNWSAAAALIGDLFGAALLAAEDVAFLNGNGVGKPLGILKSPLLKKVNRAGANAVAYADLVALEAELLAGEEEVFVVNPRVIPQLRVMEDTEGHLIWQDNAREGGVPTLLGRQVVKNFRSPALGSLGDVLLCAGQSGKPLSAYVIKDGVGTILGSSEHVHYLKNKTVIKAFRSVDGHPWMSGPVAQEDGLTYSPFVALDVPA